MLLVDYFWRPDDYNYRLLVYPYEHKWAELVSASCAIASPTLILTTSISYFLRTRANT